MGDMAKAKRHIMPFEYKLFYEKAFLLEKEAALLMSSEEKYPLTRGEMLRNAAALAYKADKYEEAHKLAVLCRAEDLDGYTLLKLDELEMLIHEALAMSINNASLAAHAHF